MTVRGSYSSAVSIWVRMAFAAVAIFALFMYLTIEARAIRVIFMLIYGILAVFFIAFRIRVTITDQWFTVKLLGFTLVRWRIEDICDCHVIPSNFIPFLLQLGFWSLFQWSKRLHTCSRP